MELFNNLCIVKMDRLPSSAWFLDASSRLGCTMNFSGGVVTLNNESSELYKEDQRRRQNPYKKDLTCRKHITAFAGMGRFSGAVHGSRSRKGRRRRRPVKPDDIKEDPNINTEKGPVDEVGRTVPIDNYFYGGKFEDENDNTAFDDHVYDDIDDQSHSADPYPPQQSPSSHGRKGLYKQLENLRVEAGKTYEQTARAVTDTESWKEGMRCERPLHDGLEKATGGRPTRGKKWKKHSNHNGTILSPRASDSLPLEEIAPVAATIVTDPDAFESSEPHKAQEPSVESDSRFPENEGMADTLNFEKSNMHESVVPEQQMHVIKTNEIKGVEETSTTRMTVVAERPADDALESFTFATTEGRDTSVVSTASLDEEGREERIGASSLILHQHPKNGEGEQKDQILRLQTLQHDDEAESTGIWIEASLVAPLDSSSTVASTDSQRHESILQPLEQLFQPETQVAGQMIKSSSETIAGQLSEGVEIPNKVKDQASQVAEHVTESLPDVFKEKVGQEVDNLEKLPSHVAEQVTQVAEHVIQMGQKVVDQVAEALPDPVIEQVGQVVEQVSQAAEQIVEQVATQVVDPVSSQFVSFLSNDEDGADSDDEFEAYRTSDLPEFKGIEGLQNFTILQEDQGILSTIHDFYTFMLKKSFPEFALGMFAAPILVSMIFTLLYLPEFRGLALEETARQFFEPSDAGLQLSWQTVFQLFMFSVSLSTGLQPELAPVSPYTLVVANVNSLVAQLLFVFLSGAVFARLSQPSQPIRCSKVAVVSPPVGNRRLRPDTCHKVLIARYVLAGPQPSELVDVKVDLTYKYNTLTRSGTYFRATQSLKLIRPEVAYLNHGMLVRHVIDARSPLHLRTPEMLEREDAVFYLSVVGLERCSMQPVFHVQYYCVHDGDVIWDAEFEDMILINKKNRRIVDHSLLSKYRPVETNQ